MFCLLTLILPYSAIILFAWIHLRRKAERSAVVTPEDYKLPKVSLIIAARNEENNLAYLIGDLQKLEYPEDKVEIFIVDDNSTDATAKLIKEAGKIKYLASPGEGKKQALATALSQSSGELILTTDADCRIPRGWIRSHAEGYISDSADMLIGQVNTLPGKGLIKQFSSLEFNSLQAITKGFALAGLPIMCNGSNLGFRIKAVPDYLEAVRADLSSGDDMFLLHYMKKNKKKICWLNNTEGRVETGMPGRAGALLRQRSRWSGKALSYKDPLTIIVGLATLFSNLSLLAATILLIASSSFLYLVAACYLLKTIPEFLLLAGHLENPGKRRKLTAFLPLSLVYPLYVLIIALLSPFLSRKW